MGVVPILLCVELNTLLGSGMIFASGVAYGFMALGKKWVVLRAANTPSGPIGTP